MENLFIPVDNENIPQAILLLCLWEKGGILSAKDVMIMIPFQKLDLQNKEKYDAYLMHCGKRGCEYNFANLFLWGRQKAAFYGENLVFFSQFNQRSVYLFPICRGDLKPTLDAIIHDAHTRGIPCRLTSLTHEDCEALEALYPGQFHMHHDRNSFDYLYNIEDLATLKGKKFQKKRNHLNKFRQLHPDYRLVPITDENTPLVQQVLERWYEKYLEKNPVADIHMEQVALTKALRHRAALGMEGMLLMDGGEVLAMTLGSPLSGDCFDVQFEKALDETAYVAICSGFAAHLMEKYPNLRYLNREDDLGLEGLRKSKLAYNPVELIEKHWACLREDGCEY